MKPKKKNEQGCCSISYLFCPPPDATVPSLGKLGVEEGAHHMHTHIVAVALSNQVEVEVDDL